MKSKRKIMTAFVMAVLLTVMSGNVSLAYFDRGAVGVSVGKKNVTLEQGQSETISVTFSPAQSSQLPGCGMAECPQSCGEKNCLDENGECKCNGTTYQTYYAFATTTSSNTSVATADYGNGVINVHAISPGTATITVTASLRQFNSTSTSISVTVKEKASETTNSSSSEGNKNNSSSEGGNVTARPVTNQPSGTTQSSQSSESKTSEEIVETNEENGYTTIQSERGSITFVPIKPGKMGKEELEGIAGEQAYIDFQMKDESETVLYAWEFCGTDIKEADDLDLQIDIGTQAFEGCTYGSPSDSIYLQFAQQGKFPGKASVFIKVSDWFANDDLLYLYRYNGENKITVLEEGLQIENGYVTISLDEGADYILSTEKWEAEDSEELAEMENEDSADTEAKSASMKGSTVAMIVIVIIAFVIGVVVILQVRKRKKEA